MDRIDKIMQIAEELANTRSRAESTMISLKSQLIGLKEQIDITLDELETYGLEAPLGRVRHIQDHASVVHRQASEIKQLSASLDQALGYIKAAKKLTGQ